MILLILIFILDGSRDILTSLFQFQHGKCLVVDSQYIYFNNHWLASGISLLWCVYYNLPIRSMFWERLWCYNRCATKRCSMATWSRCCYRQRWFEYGMLTHECWVMNLFLHFCWDYYFILYWLTVRIVNDNCLSYRRYAFLIKKSNFESWDNDNTYIGWTTDDLGVFPLSLRPNLSCLQTMTGWYSGTGIV